MKSSGYLFLLVSLVGLPLGCKGCKEEAATPYLTVLEGSTPDSLAAMATVGGATVEVPILVRNQWGASVSGQSVTISVEGPTASAESTTVSVDPWGYAMASVGTQGPEAFTVTPVSSGDGLSGGDSATCQSTLAPVPDLGLMPAWPLDGVEEPIISVAVSGGVLIADGPQVWFAPTTTGIPPHPVLQLSSDVRGLRAVQFDGDGSMDAYAWNEIEMVVLRGQSGGGMGWSCGFSPANGMDIAGVSAGDVNGDNAMDLGVGLTDNADSQVVFLDGDGVGTFTEGENVEFTGTDIQDILLANSDKDGVAEINILDSTNKVIRYTRGDSGWAETGTSGLSTGLSTPSTFLGAADLNGGGTDDLVLVGPPTSELQDAVFFTTDQGTKQWSLHFAPFYAAIGDLSGDGIEDLLFMENEQLQIVTSDDVEDDFVQRNVGNLVPSGPTAVGEWIESTGDRPDLAVAGEALFVFPGGEGVDPGQWLPVETGWVDLGFPAVLPEPVDMDDDGATDGFVGFTEFENVLSFTAWTVTRDDKGVQVGIMGSVELGKGVTPLAVRWWDNAAWVLVSGASNELIRFAPDTSKKASPIPVEMGRIEVQGTLLVCGAFADGGLVGVADVGGDFEAFDASLTSVGTSNIGNLVDVTAADTDGDGIDTPVACTTTDCSIAAADVEGDGTDEVFTVDRGTLVVAGWGTQTTLAGAGILTVGDVDGDGYVDVVAASDRLIWVWRGLVNGLAPAIGYHTRDAVSGPVRLADVDDDGLVEILQLDADNYVVMADARAK